MKKLDFSNIFNTLGKTYVDFFYVLGYFGHFFIFFITCGLIYHDYAYFIIFIIMFILNKLLNEYLKNTFRQYRPSNPIKFLNSEILSKKNFGMPSGHTQIAFFSILYAYLVTRRFIPWILLLLVIGLIVIYERYKYRNHTLNQLFAGAIIGSLLAYLTYSFTTFLIRIIT